MAFYRRKEEPGEPEKVSHHRPTAMMRSVFAMCSSTFNCALEYIYTYLEAHYVGLYFSQKVLSKRLVLCVLRIEVSPPVHPIISLSKSTDVGYLFECSQIAKVGATEQLTTGSRTRIKVFVQSVVVG